MHRATTPWFTPLALTVALLGTVAADASAGKPIGGAWGQSLGAGFERFGEGDAGLNAEGNWFEFHGPSSVPILKRFKVLTTPVGYRIFGIVAEDSLGDRATCSKWAGGLYGTLAKVYQGDTPPTELREALTRLGFEIAQPTIGRRIIVTCSDSGELALHYLDDALLRQAADEAQEMLSLVASYQAGRVAAVLPRLRELAALGQGEAEYLTGLAYLRGEAVARNQDLATTLYRRAAFKGVGQAQLGLGRLEMERGNGEDALAFMLKAARAGLPAAQFNVCLMYSGSRVIVVDNVQAWRWCDAAATTGHEKAARERDDVESRLTPAQLAIARQQSEQWLASRRRP